MATYRVDNQSELNSAIQKARGGDSILLSAGRYGKLELDSDLTSMKHVKFGSSVTIASADTSRPAVVGALNIDGAANVSLSGLKFDHVGGGGSSFRISDSSGVSVKRSVFDGQDGRDGYGTGHGLKVSNSSGIVVEDNTSFNFANGFTFLNVDNLVMRNNDVSRMGADGARFAGVNGAKILDNTFHDQDSSPWLRHKDAIQFWTSDREGPSRNVVISGNDFSNAEVAQTIFMGNDLARRDPTKGYRDILIEDNVIRGGHSHGISIEHVNGAVIRDNLLERERGVPDKPIYTPIINVGDKSVNVTIVGNEVSSVQRAANATWRVAGNDITDDKAYQHWLGDAASGGFDRSASELYRSWIQGSSARSSGDLRMAALSAPDDDTFRFDAPEEGSVRAARDGGHAAADLDAARAGDVPDDMAERAGGPADDLGWGGGQGDLCLQAQAADGPGNDLPFAAHPELF
jgi:hypothetical protein